MGFKFVAFGEHTTRLSIFTSVEIAAKHGISNSIKE